MARCNTRRACQLTASCVARSAFCLTYRIWTRVHRYQGRSKELCSSDYPVRYRSSYVPLDAGTWGQIALPSKHIAVFDAFENPRVLR